MDYFPLSTHQVIAHQSYNQIIVSLSTIQSSDAEKLMLGDFLHKYLKRKWIGNVTFL